MTTFIIIATVITIAVVISALVAMIVIKTGVTAPNWRKVGKVLGWMAGVIAVILICLFVWNHVPNKQTVGVPQPQTAPKSEVLKAPEYEWYWKLPAGHYVNGRNETAEN